MPQHISALRRHVPLRGFVRVCSPLLLAFVCSTAVAQSSPYFIGLSQTLGHDSNLLRLGREETAPVGFTKQDSYSTTTLLAGFNQGIGRQRVSANASLRDTRYDRNSVFNNQGYSLRGALDWSTVERLSGAVNFSANRNLQRFGSEEVGFLREKNLETVQTLSARAVLGLVTRYSLEISGGHTGVRNSLQQRGVQAREFEQDNAAIGLRWSPSSFTSLGVTAGVTQGRYPKFRISADGFVADRFKRDDIGVTANLRFSGASSVEARISDSTTVYDLNAQRNFKGLTGYLGWTWQPTSKLVFVSSARRDTGQESYATAVFTLPAIADYSRENTVMRISTDYNFSAKVTFNSSLVYYRSSIVRTIDNPFLPLEAEGRDKVTQLSLGARWSPVRSVLAGCDLSNEDRRAKGALVVSLRGTTFSCYGQLSLQ